MSTNKHHATLNVDDRTYEVHVMTMTHSHNGYVEITASEIVEVTKPFPDFVAKRQELIDFAKTGAPPASPYGFTSAPLALQPGETRLYNTNGDVIAAWTEGNISDAAWVDNCPTYSAVLAARDEKHSTRAVPRMVEQKPYAAPLVVEKHVDTGCLECVNAICEQCCDVDQAFGNQNIRIKIKGPVSPAQFALDFHASNQRWWTDLHTGEKIDRNMGEMIMLVTSEIAEAMEGERKNLMDDHLPHRKMAEVELADAIIRIADIVGSMGRAASTMFERRLPYLQRSDLDVPENKGEALNNICNPLAQIAPRAKRYEFSMNKFARVWHRIERYAAKHSYDLWGAVFEKMEYNKTRTDHTLEARKAANGKKF